MKNRLSIGLFLLICSNFSFGQDRPECYLKKYFLLIQSTKDYQTALQTARQAASGLKIKLDLRGMIKDKNKAFGLSMPADTCLKYTEEEEGVRDSSCYLARGRWDDGIYISIEESNAYQGFSKGYYIVVVGSGDKKTEGLVAILNKVKAKYSDAYLKSCRVYMCCMH